MNRADRHTRMCFDALATSRREVMPIYTFKLIDDSGGIEDDFGVSLANTAIAYGYACDVVRELMNHREHKTRHWRLDVYEDSGEKVFDIPFVQLDRTLDHLAPKYRALVEEEHSIAQGRLL